MFFFYDFKSNLYTSDVLNLLFMFEYVLRSIFFILSEPEVVLCIFFLYISTMFLLLQNILEMFFVVNVIRLIWVVSPVIKILVAREWCFIFIMYPLSELILFLELTFWFFILPLNFWTTYRPIPIFSKSFLFVDTISLSNL